MATDTKWTPGPWHTDRPCVTWQNGFGLWTRPVHTSVAGRGFMVAGRTEAEATANARIVAAAPDLYAALDDVLTTIRIEVEAKGGTKRQALARIEVAEIRARAALRRARGGS